MRRQTVTALTSMNSRFSISNFNVGSKPKSNRSGEIPTILESMLKYPLLNVQVLGLGTPPNNPCAKTAYFLYRILGMCCLAFVAVRYVMENKWTGTIDQLIIVFCAACWYLQVLGSSIGFMYLHFNNRLKLVLQFDREFDIGRLIYDGGNPTMLRRFAICANFYVYFSILLGSLVNNLPYAGLYSNVTPVVVFIDVRWDWLMILANTYALSIWISAQVIFVDISCYLTKCWRSYAALFHAKLRQNQPLERVVDDGLQHLKLLMKLSESVNDAFAFYAMVQLAMCMLMIIATVYVMALPYGINVKLPLSIWLLGALFQGFCIIFSSGINSAACSAKQAYTEVYVEYSIRIRREGRCDSSQLVTLSMAEILMTALDNRDMGMTLCHTGLIDRTLLITVFSVVINYLFLLIQFALDSDKNNGNCSACKNCSQCFSACQNYTLSLLG